MKRLLFTADCLFSHFPLKEKNNKSSIATINPHNGTLFGVKPYSCPFAAEGLEWAESGFVHVSYLQQDTRLPAAWRTQWLCPNPKVLPWCLLTWSAPLSEGRSHSNRGISNAVSRCGRRQHEPPSSWGRNLRRILRHFSANRLKSHQVKG